jgi:hypothetical protein
MERAGKPRHRLQNPTGEGESAGSARVKAFGVNRHLTVLNPHAPATAGRRSTPNPPKNGSDVADVQLRKLSPAGAQRSTSNAQRSTLNGKQRKRRTLNIEDGRPNSRMPNGERKRPTLLQPTTARQALSSQLSSALNSRPTAITNPGRAGILRREVARL